MTLALTSTARLIVTKHNIPAHGHFPNTSLYSSRPLLIYSPFNNQLSGQAPSPSEIEETLQGNGYDPAWRYNMYSTSHFHSTTHEVLVVYRGAAKLLFGGEDNPHAVERRVEAGDVIVVPAGLAHRSLDQDEGGFHMVGAYPAGSAQWDMCHGRPDEDASIPERIKGLATPQKDPIYGANGPLTQHWS